MKANAPEKIYLQENTTTDCYGEFWPEWFEARNKDADIEYTRTDVFIEKACEWLKDMACYYAHMEVNGDTYENEIVYDNSKLIEDFKKYMEEPQ